MDQAAQASPVLVTLYVVAVFLAVAALAVYALRFLSRRWPGLGSARHLRLIEQLYLGPNRMVCLVAVPGRVLVLGVAERSVEVLTVLDDPETVAALQAGTASPVAGGASFASRLRQLLGRDGEDRPESAPDATDAMRAADGLAAAFHTGADDFATADHQAAAWPDGLQAGLARLRRLQERGVDE